MPFEVEAAREAVRAGDWEKAMRLVHAADAPLETAKAYHALGKGLYWKDKNLPNSRKALAEGIAYAGTHSSDDVRGMEKAMNYDLASFCWPGWDEASIAISKEDVVAGELAAHRNLVLAIELKRGDSPLSNAHFMIGAYHLTGRRFADALISFSHFRSHASAAGDPSSTKLADGYMALTEWLSGDEDAEETFVEIVDKLRASPDPNEAFFAQQLQTVLKVCRQ